MTPACHPSGHPPARLRLPCRRHRLPRCRGCGLHAERCLCPTLPRLVLPFDLWLIQHAAEFERPTNTGRILHTMVPASRILPYGWRDQPFDAAAFEAEGVTPFLLFPAPDAPVLAPTDLAPNRGRRPVAVLLDGTWTQGSRMRRRIPSLRGLPCFALPAGPPGRWRLRRPHAPGLLCTLEAATRLVDLAGLHAEAALMAEAQDRIMRDMLAMKGRVDLAN